MKSIGSLVEGHYVLEAVVRSTRETLVFKAADRINGAPVIVKFFYKNYHHAESFYEIEVQLFKACAGIAGIPALLSSGEEDGQKYLITDYLGCSLSEVIESGKSFADSSLQLLGRALLVIIQAIHERGFLYLNFAPENILIDLHTSCVSLIDFKFAACCSELLSIGIDSQPSRNPLFESTDRLLGHTPGYRSDIESLSYVLMYLETGSLPWKSELRSDGESISAIIHSRRRLPRSEFFRNLSDQLRRLWTFATTLDIEAQPDYEQLKSIFQQAGGMIRFEDTRSRKDEPSPQRDEGRKRTAQKEGPELTPSLRSLISQFREDRE